MTEMRTETKAEITADHTDQADHDDDAARAADRELRPAGPIVPRAGIESRSLLVVISIMSFLAAITVGLVATVWQTSAGWEADIGREITVQIRPVADVDLAAETNRVVDIAAGYDGVVSVRALSDGEISELLEPWIGDTTTFDTLPVPRLVIIEIDPDRPPDIASLTAHIASETAGATVDDHAVWQERLKVMARTVIVCGLGILGLVLVATVLSITYATRGAMAANHDIVEVLHFVGATRRFVAREFGGRFLTLGLKSATIGVGAAAVLFLGLTLAARQFVATPAGVQIEALFGNFAIGAMGYAGIVLLVPVIALLTGLTSRREVIEVLKRLDRDMT
ncbi:MAG: ABC transporter permease [Pseudomonadota bacterium]